MRFTSQLIAGAAMAAIGAVANAQAVMDSNTAPAVQMPGAIASGEFSEIEGRVQPFESKMTRAQVRAEMFEARRLGLLEQVDELTPLQVTPEQAEMIRLAGLRARDGASNLVGR